MTIGEKQAEKTITITITVPVSEVSKIFPGFFRMSNDENSLEIQSLPSKIEERGDVYIITIPRKKHAGGRPRTNVPADSIVLPGQAKESK